MIDWKAVAAAASRSGTKTPTILLQIASNTRPPEAEAGRLAPLKISDTLHFSSPRLGSCLSCSFSFIWPSLRFLGVLAKLRKSTISYVTSIRLFAWNNSAPTGRIFIKFDI